MRRRVGLAPPGVGRWGKPHPTFVVLMSLWMILPSGLAAEEIEPLLPSSSADREVLEQAFVDSRVATAPPRPGLSLYVSDAGVAASTWLSSVIERFLPGFGRLADWFLAVSWGLLIGVLVTVVAIVGLGVARRWWRERSGSREDPTVEIQPVAVTDARWSPERWEEEIRRRLSGQEITAAVEALWWWLASRLFERDVDPSWTSRELLSRAGRADLRPQIRRLDRMIYGPGTPPADDVRLLFDELREMA